MSPPAAAVIVVGVVATAATVYVIKEYAWEPHIEPQLQKMSAAVKNLWTERTKRPVKPIAAATALFRRRKESPAQTPNDRDDAESSRPLVATANDGGNITQDTLRSRANARLPQEPIEMMELDKANTFIPHVPLTPSHQQISRSDSPVHDPFADLGSGAPGLRTPPASDHESGPVAGPSTHGGLQLSTSAVPTPYSLHTASPLSHTRSLSASVFSWTDAMEDVHSRSEFDDDDAEREEDDHAFSIGSIDDQTMRSSTSGSDASDEEDIPSDRDGEGPISVGSWESVGSPSSASERLV